MGQDCSPPPPPARARPYLKKASTSIVKREYLITIKKKYIERSVRALFPHFIYFAFRTLISKFIPIIVIGEKE